MKGPGGAFACRADGKIRKRFAWGFCLQSQFWSYLFFPAFRENFLLGLDGPPGRRRSSCREDEQPLSGGWAKVQNLPNTFWAPLGPCLTPLEGGQHSGGGTAGPKSEPPGQQPLLCSSLRVWFLMFLRISRPSGMFSMCECKIPKAPPSRHR